MQTILSWGGFFVSIRTYCIHFNTCQLKVSIQKAKSHTVEKNQLFQRNVTSHKFDIKYFDRHNKITWKIVNYNSVLNVIVTFRTRYIIALWNKGQIICLLTIMISIRYLLLSQDFTILHWFAKCSCNTMNNFVFNIIE